ncbi:MAG: phage tail protein I [Phenylobacterium sp.]|nr:phage tail protein I [Phenylobacterium sp.]
MSVAASLLPPTAEPFLQALSEGLAPAADLPVHLLGALWDPDNAPEPALAPLAQAMGVTLWRETWPVAKKRHVIKETIALMRRRGTLEAFDRFLKLVDVDLVAAHAPPQRLVPRGNKPADERRRWARQFPEIRVRTVAERHRLPAAFVAGRSVPGRAPRASIAHLYAGLRAELIIDGQTTPASAEALPDGSFRLKLQAQGDPMRIGRAPGRAASSRRPADRVYAFRAGGGSPVLAPAQTAAAYQPDHDVLPGHSRTALVVGRALGRRVPTSKPIASVVASVRVLEPAWAARSTVRPYGGWFAGRGRLGQDRFTLRLDVDVSRVVRGRRPFPLSPSGALRPTDHTRIEDTLAAARAAKLGRDQVLVRTNLYHPIGPGDFVPLDGSMLPGQIVRSL